MSKQGVGRVVSELQSTGLSCAKYKHFSESYKFFIFIKNFTNVMQSSLL